MVPTAIGVRTMANQLAEYLREILFPNRDRHGIPSLDGAWRANDTLEQLEVVARIEAPDDIVAGADGALYLSSGRRLLRLEPGATQKPTEMTRAGAALGGLCPDRAGGILAATAGEGVLRIGADGTIVPLGEEESGAPKHVTAVLALPDGSVLACEGARAHAPADWVQDLMRKGRSGRLMRFDPDTGRWQTLDHGLAWPAGLCLSSDGDTVLMTEAWTHRLLRYPVDDIGPKTREVVIGNMPGYPARVRPASAGGYWMSLFAMRTALVELVLEETALREEMIETMEPDHWIAPALSATGDPHEFTQLGRVRVLGYLKPWAPPRSYGLVVRLDEQGQPVSSMHSRASGSRHGITGLCTADGALWIAARGCGLILRAEEVRHER